MIVPCECGAKLKINDAKISGRNAKVRCPRCGNVVPVRGAAAQPALVKSGPVPSGAVPNSHLVLIAHDSDVIRKMIGDVLTDAGFRVEMAADGTEALKKAIEQRPQGMVLDVGLPGIYGFEICERLKGNPDTKSIKIVLLSSVYDMRRYKRTPANLYGADDYIEKHHIPDFLADKLQRLIDPEQFADPEQAPSAAAADDHFAHNLPEMSRPPAREFDPALLSDDRTANAESAGSAAHANAGILPEIAGEVAITPESLSLDASIFQKEECDIPKAGEYDTEGIEKARRFSRIIVSDIALYNQDAVVEGIKNGTFYEVLKNDVDEGRELYERRIPEAIKAQKDYYQEAFDNFIASARRKIVH